MMENNQPNHEAENEEPKPAKETKETKKDTKNRQFILNDNVDASTVKPIIQGILDINKYDDEQAELDPAYIRKPIKFIIDSYGGGIYEGFALMGVMDTSVTPIHTYCYSKAMSMGFALFVMGHRRFAHPLATFMYHDGATTLRDKLVGIQQSLDQSKKIVGMIDHYVTAYTRLTQKQLDRTKRLKIEWYMFTEEAADYGVVDEILTSTRGHHRND